MEIPCSATFSEKLALYWISIATWFFFLALDGQQCRWCFVFWELPFSNPFSPTFSSLCECSLNFYLVLHNSHWIITNVVPLLPLTNHRYPNSLKKKKKSLKNTHIMKISLELNLRIEWEQLMQPRSCLGWCWSATCYQSGKDSKDEKQQVCEVKTFVLRNWGVWCMKFGVLT